MNGNGSLVGKIGVAFGAIPRLERRELALSEAEGASSAHIPLFVILTLSNVESPP